MAFVYSVLTEEEKLLLQPYHLQNPVSKGMPAWLYDQVYDKERNIRLVIASRGIFPTGFRERPMVFAFLWNEDICSISLYYDVEEKSNGEHQTASLIWDFHRIYAPKSLASKKNELLSLIKEALKAYQLPLSRYQNIIDAVSFVNIPQIRFIDNKQNEKFYYGV